MSGIEKKLWFVFIFILVLNLLSWLSVRDVKASWLNVPPVPSVSRASSFAVGDQQFSYRIIGMMLQNLGDTGGRTTALKDYNYETLGKWFLLQDKLDPRSNFVPFLAAYYFSAVQTPESLSPLIDYLHHIGKNPEGQKWRWLAQAVYLARYRMEDMDKAYALALELAAIDNPDMPAWPKQMPAFVLNAKGDKEAAYDLMLEMLKSDAENLHPNEVNFMRDYMCNRLLDADKAKDNPLCQDLP